MPTAVVSNFLIQNPRTDASTDEEIQSLDPSRLLSIDREYANFDARPGASQFSDDFQNASVLLAGLSGFLDGFDFYTTLLMYIEADYISSTSSGFLQQVTTFYSPVAYDTNLSLSERKKVVHKQTFSSIHISRTATAWFFLAKTYSDTHPNNSNRYWMWTAAVLGSALGAVSRVEARLHFPSDAIFATIWGGFWGWYIPETHKTDRSFMVTPIARNNYFGLQFETRF